MVGVVLLILIVKSLIVMVLTNEHCCPMGMSFKNETIISIRYSNISVIPNEMFNNCAGIKIIHITKSNIQRVNLSAFENLSELQELDLSGNIITYLADHFKNLTSLQRLNLHNNDLEKGFGLFSNLYSLRYLDMSKNYLIFLSEYVFKNNGELRELYLTSNYIDYLSKDTFINQTKLQKLHLNKNRLVEIEKELFSKMIKLRELRLDFNSISTLETGTFDNNEELQQLFLEHNAITILPQGIFQNLEKLTIISLAHNKISSIGKNVFPENLAQVHLQRNQLKYLDASFLKIGNTLSLEIYDNPWHCDCRLWAFFIATKKFHENVKCDKPKGNNNKSWSTLTIDRFQCENEPNKTCMRDAQQKKISYTINASNIFCQDDNDGIYVTNGRRYKMTVNDTRLELEYIDADKIDSEPQCLEGILIAVEAVLLVILFIVTYFLVKKLKQRATAISQNDSRKNTNIYTEPVLPPTTVSSYSEPDYEVENILYGIELKTN